MKRRTKVQYARLFDDPTTLFSNCRVILYPNGEPEIWIQSLDGRRSIKLTGGDGPAGLGINVERCGIGGAPLSVVGNLADDAWPPSDMTDYVRFGVVQYRDDSWSQRFKAWCGDRTKTTEYPGDAPADRETTR